MLAIREIVDRNNLGSVTIPTEFGQRVEVIILPVLDTPSAESFHAMRLQETTGFAKEVLAASSEDVWNDLVPSATIPQDR